MLEFLADQMKLKAIGFGSSCGKPWLLFSVQIGADSDWRSPWSPRIKQKEHGALLQLTLLVSLQHFGVKMSVVLEIAI